MQLTTYEKLTARKRNWEPVKMTKGTLARGSEATIKKALALRCLELPVKEFLEQGLAKELPDKKGLTAALISNQQDEEKHDRGLGYVVSAYGVNEEAEREAQTIRNVWLDNPEHPILKASVLERSVFFVLLPFFRFNGCVGLRTLSADISRDEQIHTATHGMVCHDLGLPPSKSLDKLRKATVDWVMSDLGLGENKYLNRTFWMRQSDSLYSKGKAIGLTDTKRARMNSFFECSNLNLPQYG